MIRKSEVDDTNKRMEAHSMVGVSKSSVVEESKRL